MWASELLPSSTVLTSDGFSGADATYNSTTGRNTDAAAGGTAMAYSFPGGIGFNWGVISNAIFLTAKPSGNVTFMTLETGYRNCTVQVKIPSLAANTKFLGIAFRDATTDDTSLYHFGYFNNAFGGAANGVVLMNYDGTGTPSLDTTFATAMVAGYQLKVVYTTTQINTYLLNAAGAVLETHSLSSTSYNGASNTRVSLFSGDASGTTGSFDDLIIKDCS